MICDLGRPNQKSWLRLCKLVNKGTEILPLAITSHIAIASGVRRIFERGWGGNLRRMKTKKRSSIRFSPFFCPDLDEDQKKGLHPDLVGFSAQIFCPNSRDGGHDSFLRTILRYLCITGTPKGGCMTQCPLLYTPLAVANLCN